jgi:hypothetical protein
MPRIRCHYTDCIFIDDGYCSAAAVEIDPDTGCATYSPTEESAKEAGWDEDEELEEWEEIEEEDEDDMWLEDEEDEY